MTAKQTINEQNPEHQQTMSLLAQRLTHLEYQIDNQSFLSKTELNQVLENYEKDREALLQLIQIMAMQMDYPPMKQWSDTEPMAVLHRMSGNKLAATNAYQEILGQLILT